MSMTSMNVLIDSELYKKLRIKCLQQGKPVKAVIPELIEIYVEDEEDEQEPQEKNPSSEKTKED